MKNSSRPPRVRGQKYLLSISIAAMTMIVNIGAFAQLPAGYDLISIPTGLQPLGIDISTPKSGPSNTYFAVVANSKGNSLSIVRVAAGERASLLRNVDGIPSPFAVSTCSVSVSTPGSAILNQLPNYALISSSYDSLIRMITVPDGKVVGTIQAGPQPGAILCFLDSRSDKIIGLVSNLGDNSLSILDITSKTLMGTIPNVPGSRQLHGIAVFPDVYRTGSMMALVASAEANVVTLVDLIKRKPLIYTPVSRPAAAVNIGGGQVAVASAGDSKIVVFDDVNHRPSITYPNFPSPKDFVMSTFGYFATVESQNSLAYWTFETLGTKPSVIPGIPEASALAVARFAIENRSPRVSVGTTAYSSAVLATSPSSNSLFVLQIPPPLPPYPVEFRIQNAAGFGGLLVAPGSIATSQTRTGIDEILPTFPSAPLPTSLGGVSLSLGGSFSLDTAINRWTYTSIGAIPAPLLSIGPNEIIFQIPPDVGTGITPARLTLGNGSTLLTNFVIATAAPGIFTLLLNGSGQGTVLNDDYSQNGDSLYIAGARPAEPGSVIHIYSTGAGSTTPPLQAGEAAPVSGDPRILTDTQPTVTIGGIDATVLSSTMTPGFVGLWEIQVVIPQGVPPGNVVPLVVSAGGAVSNSVTIALK